MFPRPFRPYPSYTRAMPYMPAPFGLFGGALFICGLIAIGSYFAPAAVEQAIPGWRERLGALVMIGVVLGFMRSIWRLFIPILGVAFWVVAVLCLWKPDLSTVSLPLISSAAPSSARQIEQPRMLPAYLSTQKSLPPALPDSAYFAPHSSADSLAGGVNSFMRKVIHWRL
jgi:hypothetical protein